MKNNTSGNDGTITLKLQEQNENNPELGDIEKSEESFLSYLLREYDQDKTRDKQEFMQKFNEFMQEENCATDGNNELDLSKLVLAETKKDMIVFDGKKFKCLIYGKEDIIYEDESNPDRIKNIVEFILKKKVINNCSFLVLGKSLAKNIIESKNTGSDSVKENDEDRQPENKNIEWTRAEYKEQLMLLIESAPIVFDLKLQRKILPGNENDYCYMSDFMPNSINNSDVLLELLEKGKNRGVDVNINTGYVIETGNISKFTDGSISCLDDLLDYSVKENTQKIDLADLKCKLKNGAIWSLSKFLNYFDGIDLHDLDSVASEQINGSKVKSFLSNLDNLKYFVPEAFLDLFDNECSLLSNPKVCKLLNLKAPQDKKDSVWKLKLKLVFMRIVTFGFYSFLGYDGEICNKIFEIEYRNGRYFENIKNKYSQSNQLLRIQKILKKTKNNVSQIRDNVNVLINNLDTDINNLSEDVEKNNERINKLESDKKRINKRIRTLESNMKKYEEDRGNK